MSFEIQIMSMHINDTSILNYIYQATKAPATANASMLYEDPVGSSRLLT